MPPSTATITLFIGCFASLASLSTSFSPDGHRKLSRPKTIPHTQFNLVPLSDAWDASSCNDEQLFADLVAQLGCKSLDSKGRLIQTTSIDEDDEENTYRLYLATNVDDLPPIAELTIDVFDASAITLSSTTDWSAMEKMVVGALVQPTISMYNAYAAAVGYTEVLSGLRRRMRNRIVMDNEDATTNYDWLAPLVVPGTTSSLSSDTTETSLEIIAAQSSIILVLAKPTDAGDMQAVASVEVRLQPTDAKIPFSQPWLDKIERRLARFFPFDDSVPIATNTMAATTAVKTEVTNKSKSAPLRPYLCNLCVSPSLRSKGIGRALCRIVEAISHKKWQYSHLYLHVDPDNNAAVSLYENEGFVDVGRRWNASWNGGANKIGYYVKRLGKESK
mmetsp:Transcript_19659/g.32234  ORF Transcript_19659/g.32234 Transcript_19659/m.32234 type:complete len:389 (+) Transcript_19659:19-1185(+)